jgi:hypothetical protein
MLNQPPNYPISLFIDNAETPPKLWPVVPRIGETVEPKPGERFRIVDIVHGFSRPSAQIILILDKAK